MYITKNQSASEPPAPGDRMDLEQPLLPQSASLSADSSTAFNINPTWSRLKGAETQSGYHSHLKYKPKQMILIYFRGLNELQVHITKCSLRNHSK